MDTDGADAGAVGAVADELYALPPGEFTAARDARARAARAAGDRPLAAAIRALRRPTLAAWACNLLARDRPPRTGPLLRLGEDLRRAQRAADGPRLRELAAERRRVVPGLVARALDLTARAGHPVSDAAAREVENTLYAVLADPAAAGEWTRGRLTRPLTAPPAFGLGPVGAPGAGDDGPGTGVALDVAPPDDGRVVTMEAVRGRRDERERRERSQRAEEARRAAEEARRTADLREGDRARAEDEAAHADARLRAADELAGDLRSRLARAEEDRRAARESARTARERARGAERTAREARRRADDATAAAERLAGDHEHG